MKNWVFEDPIHNKGPMLVILVARLIKKSGSGSFFEKKGLQRLLRPARLQRTLRSIRLQRFLRPEKSLLRTAESSRFLSLVIWGLKSLYFDGLKKIYFYRIMLNFSTFSVRGCWGQPLLFFWKLVDQTQMPKPQEHTDIFVIT